MSWTRTRLGIVVFGALLLVGLVLPAAPALASDPCLSDNPPLSCDPDWQPALAHLTSSGLGAGRDLSLYPTSEGAGVQIGAYEQPTVTARAASTSTVSVRLVGQRSVTCALGGVTAIYTTDLDSGFVPAPRSYTMPAMHCGNGTLTTGRLTMHAEGRDDTGRVDATPDAVWMWSATLTADFQVAEWQTDVWSGLVAVPGDRIEINADGTIWSGLWLHPRNGPEGESGTIDQSYPGFPPSITAPTPAPYSLLGYLGPSYYSNAYFPVGPHRVIDSYPGTANRLWLRINDNCPGNGDGAFNVHVIINRAP